LISEKIFAASMMAVAAHQNIIAAYLLTQGLHVDGRTLPRNKKTRRTYEDSQWARYRIFINIEALRVNLYRFLCRSLLRDHIADLKTPGSPLAKSFRLRFRVPFPVFEEMVTWTNVWLCKEGLNETDAVGNPTIPTCLKVMAVLRILGRGSCADEILEQSGMSVPTTLKFLHKFCK
jgi:hypothetical protein